MFAESFSIKSLMAKKNEVEQKWLLVDADRGYSGPNGKHLKENFYAT